MFETTEVRESDLLLPVEKKPLTFRGRKAKRSQPNWVMRIDPLVFKILILFHFLWPVVAALPQLHAALLRFDAALLRFDAALLRFHAAFSQLHYQ
ncbi:hypothetical protein AVEN_152239-1 [Araneus ventricosus]|uniref:Uncharacterized protein n=1 Tax=Araneus ventricosus TaxID=182803 RepID=A0A4Y2KB36_ARAVE|nr:hypothetical protein AVEN_152239-1 [Araneus ventricosus]